METSIKLIKQQSKSEKRKMLIILGIALGILIIKNVVLFILF
jgi:hypothetical protein